MADTRMDSSRIRLEKEFKDALFSGGRQQQLKQVQLPLQVYEAAHRFTTNVPTQNGTLMRYAVLHMLSSIVKSAMKDKDLSGDPPEISSLQEASKALLRIPMNLLLAPNRPEFKRLKLTTPFWVYQVSRKMPGAHRVLEGMGYQLVMNSRTGVSVSSSDYILKECNSSQVLSAAVDLIIFHEELNVIKQLISRAHRERIVTTISDILQLRDVGPSNVDEFWSVLECADGQVLTGYPHQETTYHDSITPKGTNEQQQGMKDLHQESIAWSDGGISPSLPVNLPPPAFSQAQLSNIIKGNNAVLSRGQPLTNYEENEYIKSDFSNGAAAKMFSISQEDGKPNIKPRVNTLKNIGKSHSDDTILSNHHSLKARGYIQDEVYGYPIESVGSSISIHSPGHRPSPPALYHTPSPDLPPGPPPIKVYGSREDTLEAHGTSRGYYDEGVHHRQRDLVERDSFYYKPRNPPVVPAGLGTSRKGWVCPKCYTWNTSDSCTGVGCLERAPLLVPLRQNSISAPSSLVLQHSHYNTSPHSSLSRHQVWVCKLCGCSNTQSVCSSCSNKYS